MDNNSKGKLTAIATIIIVSCAIAALASAAVWFLFFKTGGNSDEQRLYDDIKRFEAEHNLDSLKESIGNYLDLYNPDAFHYSEVKSLRDDIVTEETDWMDAESSMTIDVLRLFLKAHPNGFFHSRANSCIDSLLAVEAVRATETVEHHAADSVATDTVPEPAITHETEEDDAELRHNDHNGHNGNDGHNDHNGHNSVELDSIFN